MTEANQLYGLMAAFKDHETLLEATKQAYTAGYRKMDAYSPFPIDGLAEALGHHSGIVPLLFLVGGVTGCLGGYYMEWYAMAWDYPLNVGGKPLHTWPMFIPIAFELTVLGAALLGFIGTLALNGFPAPYHPVFNVAEFRERASSDGFFLCIETGDSKFDRVRTREFLDGLGAYKVEEVEK